MKDPKFVLKDDLTETIRSLIEKEQLLLTKNSLKSIFDPAEITECPRRLIYRSSAETPSYSYESSTYLKKKWTDFLSKCLYLKLVAVNQIVSDCNYNLTSIVDAILNIEGTLTILKIQPINQDSYVRVIKEGAIKKHVIEIMVQMWLAEIKDGILLYEHDDMHTFLHIKPYQPIIKSVKRKALELVDCQIKGTIPDRPYKTKTANECKNCEFFKKCWEE